MLVSWRQLRAFFITCALLLGFVAGWPTFAPHVLDKRPAPVAALARGLQALQQWLLRPVAPIAGAFGVYSQNWPLFRGTGGIRYRLWIDARRGDGAWVILFRAHDDAHAALRSTLEYRRVLNLWKPHAWGVPAAYPAFAHWVARQMFLQHAELEQVRVRQEEIEIRPAGMGFEPTGRFQHAQSFTRAQVLP